MIHIIKKTKANIKPSDQSSCAPSICIYVGGICIYVGGTKKPWIFQSTIRQTFKTRLNPFILDPFIRLLFMFKWLWSRSSLFCNIFDNFYSDKPSFGTKNCLSSQTYRFCDAFIQLEHFVASGSQWGNVNCVKCVHVRN